MNAKQKPSEAFLALRRHLDELCEQEDRFWLENIDDQGEAYSVLHEDAEDEIVRSFRENYRSKGFGFKPFDTLTGDEIADDLLGMMDKNKLTDLILKHTTAQACDYYVQWNEVASAQVGETEYQIDVEAGSELATLAWACTPEELKALRFQRRDHHALSVVSGSFWVYGYPCDRLIWKLDPETFLEEIEPMLRDSARAGLKVDPDA